METIKNYVIFLFFSDINLYQLYSGIVAAVSHCWNYNRLLLEIAVIHEMVKKK